MTFDIENGLREVARVRAQDNALIRETARLADKIAAGFRGDFGGVLDLETCGKAMIIAAASVSRISGEGIPGAVLVNMIALAGEALVREARDGAA